jgi:hypothetical protein
MLVDSLELRFKTAQRALQRFLLGEQGLEARVMSISPFQVHMSTDTSKKKKANQSSS